MVLTQLKEEMRKLTEKVNLAHTYLEMSVNDMVYWREKLDRLEVDKEDLEAEIRALEELNNE